MPLHYWVIAGLGVLCVVISAVFALRHELHLQQKIEDRLEKTRRRHGVKQEERMIISDTAHRKVFAELDFGEPQIEEPQSLSNRPWLQLLIIRVARYGETDSNCVRLSPEEYDLVVRLLHDQAAGAKLNELI